MKLKTLVVTSSLVAIGMLAQGAAHADGWPASIAGNWNIVGNQSAGVLSVVQFPGALGSQCKPIRGTIYGVDAFEGYYCPGSGRVAFLRKVGLAANALTRQFWAGNVSQVANVLRMGGTFHAAPHNNVAGTAGGSLGEYNFSGTK